MRIVKCPAMYSDFYLQIFVCVYLCVCVGVLGASDCTNIEIEMEMGKLWKKAAQINQFVLPKLVREFLANGE